MGCNDKEYIRNIYICIQKCTMILHENIYDNARMELHTSTKPVTLPLV